MIEFVHKTQTIWSAVKLDVIKNKSEYLQSSNIKFYVAFVCILYELPEREEFSIFSCFFEVVIDISFNFYLITH